MDVAKVIGSVFLFIGLAILAVILYDLLFAYDYESSSSAQGDGNDHMGAHEVESTGKFDYGQHGALWVLADGVQNASSFYYYNYCYLPAVHDTDELDSQLGLTSPYFMIGANGLKAPGDGYKDTPTDTSEDIVDVPSDGEWWSTDWQ